MTAEEEDRDDDHSSEDAAQNEVSNSESDVESEVLSPPSRVWDYSCDFQWLVWDGALSLAQVEALRDAVTGLIPGQSYWIDSNAAPRNALEAYALAVFKRYAGKDESGGAEFWVQDRVYKEKIPNYHFDKDEVLMKHKGLMLNPFVSTVAYLTEGGAPTVVMDVSDEQLSEASASAGFAQSEMDVIVSYPRLGKHLAFNGKFFHGATSVLSRENESFQNGDFMTRLTLPVNVWVGHRPGKCKEMSSGDGSAPAADIPSLNWEEGNDANPVDIELSDDTETERWDAKVTEEGDGVRYLRMLRFPMDALKTAEAPLMRIPAVEWTAVMKRQRAE